MSGMSAATLSTFICGRFVTLQRYNCILADQPEGPQNNLLAAEEEIEDVRQAAIRDPGSRPRARRAQRGAGAFRLLAIHGHDAARAGYPGEIERRHGVGRHGATE